MKIAKFVLCLLTFAALALPIVRPQDINTPLPPHGPQDINTPLPPHGPQDINTPLPPHAA